MVSLATLVGCTALQGRSPNAAERAVLSTCIVASDRAMGSGFLVAARTPQDQRVPVVVTSTHLITRSRGKPLTVFLRFVTPDGDTFIQAERLSPEMSGRTYATHPRGDVAAFRINWPENLPAGAVLPLIEQKEIEVRRELQAGEEVAFAGFPEGIGGFSGVFAILRTGRVASFDQRFLGLPFYVVNAAAYPGDSGGPVFLVEGRKRPRLVGMIIEYLADSADRPMPLSLAVDATVIRKTIAMLFARNDLPPLISPPPDAGTREDEPRSDERPSPRKGAPR